MTLTLALCPPYTGPSLSTFPIPARATNGPPQLYWENWRKRLRVWGLPCNIPTDPCTAGPRRPPQTHIQQGPGWAELTNIRIFVSLDDLRKLKVPCYDGHLRGGGAGGRLSSTKLASPRPWWLLLDSCVGSSSVGGPRFGPCPLPKLTIPVCTGLRGLLGHETLGAKAGTRWPLCLFP